MILDRKIILEKIRTVDPIHPQPAIITEAAEILSSGGVIMFPTTGLYGLGADATCPDAIVKVFQIKQRPQENPLLVLISKTADLQHLVTHIPVSAEKIIKEIWPGAVTLVFNAKDTVPEILTAGTGKIGIRMPEHPVALALSKAFGKPITGTSANLSGSPGCKDIDETDADVATELDLILDAGTLTGTAGSTVVDVTVDPPVILRAGRVSEKQILSVLNARQ